MKLLLIFLLYKKNLEKRKIPFVENANNQIKEEEVDEERWNIKFSV